MKKTFKKIMCVSMVAVLAVTSLVACGKKKEDNTNVWKIGSIGPITGDYAVYGTAVMNAAQIAVDEINKAGGINGYQIEFKFEDDMVDAEKSVSAYNSLKDWGMKILMGTVTSGACAVVVEKTEIDNMFQLTPSGSAVECVKGDNAFQVCFTDPNQGSASAKYIGDNDLATKVAVIYDSSSVYSAGIFATFKKEAANNGFEIVYEGAFTSDTNKDFTTQINEAKASGATLLFIPIYYQEAVLILQQAKNADYAPIFFGCDGLDGILGVDNFDTSLAEGVMLLTPFAADATDAKTKAFVEAYKAKHNGEIPNQFAADAYDAMYIIKAAIEKANLKPNASVSDICDAMAAAMLQIKVDGLTGEGMTWTKSGEVSKAPKAVVIKNGVYTLYTK